MNGWGSIFGFDSFFKLDSWEMSSSFSLLWIRKNGFVSKFYPKELQAGAYAISMSDSPIRINCN